jgi:hypothetical protein
MEKIKVRCYKAFGNVYPGVYNYPVYYFAYEGWSNKTFATCIHCGELFVVDWENPKTKGMSVYEMEYSEDCPKCNVALKDTLKNYPEVIWISEGKLGSFKPDQVIPPDSESFLMEVYYLTNW